MAQADLADKLKKNKGRNLNQSIVEGFPDNLPEMEYRRNALNRNNKYTNNTFSRTYLKNYVMAYEQTKKDKRV